MWFDLIVVLVLIVFAIRGAVKGFVYQLATILALVLGFAFAFPLSIPVSEAVPLQPPANRYAAIAILYIVFSFASFALARRLKDWMEQAKLEEYDRHLGGMFGFLKGGLLCLAGIFFAVTLFPPVRAEVLDSKSGYAAAIVMDRLHPVMPDDLSATLDPYIHQLDQPGMPLVSHKHNHDSSPTIDPKGEGPQLDPHEQPEPWRPSTFEVPPLPAEETENQIGGAPWTIQTEIMRIYQQLPQSERVRFLRSLEENAPSEIAGTLNAWREYLTKRSNPDPRLPSDPETIEQLADPKRDRLLQDIAEVLTDRTDEQRAILAEFDRRLLGVPHPIADGAVADLHADLHPPTPDPDPQTDLNTFFDERIRRQIALQRYPIDRLSQALRNRLRQ